MSHRQTFWDQNCPIGSHLNFFCRVTPKIAKKCFFFTFRQFTRVFGIGNQIRGTTMRKLRSWAFRKCCTFWVYDVLKGSYRPSKSTDFENLGPLPKIRGVTKKQHSVNNDRTDLKRIGLVVHPMGHPSYSCRVRKCIFDRVLFFCNASFSNWKMTELWQPITPL